MGTPWIGERLVWQWRGCCFGPLCSNSESDWILGWISFHRRKRRRTQPALTQRVNIENVRIREYQRQSESESSYSEIREKEYEKKKSHGTELLFLCAESLRLVLVGLLGYSTWRFIGKSSST